MTEVDAITLAQNGDPNGFSWIYERYFQTVRRACATMLSQADADDAAQDVFVILWKRIGSFRRESAFSTWLYRVTRNRALEYIRKQGRTAGKVLSFGEVADERGLENTDEIDVPDPRTEANRRKTLEEAEDMLRRLPPSYRLPLEMHADFGMEYKEIAECLGQPVGTVKCHVSRARKMLREMR